MQTERLTTEELGHLEMIGALVYRLTKGLSEKEIKDSIPFLREREVVHSQRFGKKLRLLTDKLDEKNFYAFNPTAA
ncbi:manganese catalase family protein [uncultured Ruminococcus sp.]|uniref:manganese catalase family protein n=1 Tax=uncultured Ruminococcus sp. TaxID=165186 RepID=UPI0025DAC614|nr:manganese catalase family protein [uncultured Ruminococcus sp.]